MKHITKLSMITATGLATVLLTGVTGCTQERPQEQVQEAKGVFLIIEETAEGKYKIKDEFPADETRIVLKKLDGTERILSKEEMDALVKEEAAKIDAGTSNLTKEQAPQAQSQGMSMGETIMASMAGAMLGAYIGNKLFGNQNYQNNRKAGYKSPSTYSKSKNSFNKSSSSSSSKSSSKKSGFFGNKSSKSTSSYGG